MNFNKSTVDLQLKGIITNYPQWFEKLDENAKISRAFVVHSAASYLNIEWEEAQVLVTDGGNDNGIDAIYIESTNDSEFAVTMFQTKYTRDLYKDANFPANSISLMLSVLNTIFDNADKEISANRSLKTAIAQIKDIQRNGGIPTIKCVMINNGLKWSKEGDIYIKNASLPPNISFEHYNHDNIIAKRIEPLPVNHTIRMTGISLSEQLNHKGVLIGKVQITEIASLLDIFGEKVFERNIRGALGTIKNKVNQAMRDTLTSEDKINFYFYNNGITIVCSRQTNSGLGQNWNVKLNSLQIINGGQTCRTIQSVINQNTNIDYSDTFVLVRIYEIGDDTEVDMVDKIALATNNQSPIDLRDLRSNDKLQIQLDLALKELGYTYKRKNSNLDAPNTIPSSVAAEAVLAIWRKKPTVAKFKSKELFNSYYNFIFDNLNAAQLAIAVFIFRYSDNQRRNEILIEQHMHLPYSSYFVAMLMGEKLLETQKINIEQLTPQNFMPIKQYWEANREQIWAKAVDTLEAALTDLNRHYPKIELRKLSALFRSDILLSFFE